MLWFRRDAPCDPFICKPLGTYHRRKLLGVWEMGAGLAYGGGIAAYYSVRYNRHGLRLSRCRLRLSAWSTLNVETRLVLEERRVSAGVSKSPHCRDTVDTRRKVAEELRRLPLCKRDPIDETEAVEIRADLATELLFRFRFRIVIVERGLSRLMLTTCRNKHLWWQRGLT